MGHRLWSLPGKCTQLHGHTWQVTLYITGPRNKEGLMLDYHEVKKEFRSFLDLNFDHKLCLHQNDPLVYRKEGESSIEYKRRLETFYPGVALVPFLPSTENLAEHWALYAKAVFGEKYAYKVEVWEGENNCAIMEVV